MDSVCPFVSGKKREKAGSKKVKDIAMAGGNMLLGFLAVLLLLAWGKHVQCGGGGSDAAGDGGSVITLPGRVVEEQAGKDAGVSASSPSLWWSLSSWPSSSSIVLPGSVVEERTGKESVVSSSSWWSSSLSSSLPSSTSSSSAVAEPLAGAGALHNDSKETMSCPASCFRPNPVCGVDGITYWCGSVDAECAGVEVEYTGFCDFGSKGTGGKGVLAIQSLLLVHMIWLMLAAFLVLLGVP